MAITSTQQTEILKIVSGLFNAAPGGAYLTELANLVQGGMTTSQLADALAAHSLFTGTIMAGKVTTSSQVAVLMKNFGLTADSDSASAGSQAQAYFTQQIDAGVGFGKIVYDAVQFLSGSVPPEFTTAATLLSNKALVAATYSEGNSSTSLTALQTVLGTVTGTAAYTAAEVTAILDAVGGGANVGQTFTLTTTVENKTGTASNDTFNGYVDAGNASVTTLNAGDNLSGGAGTDALQATISGTVGTTSVVGLTLSGIERLQFQNVSSAAQTVDLATATGYTTLSSYGSSQQITFNNVATLADAEMAHGTSNVTLTYGAAAVAGASDAQKLTLNNQASGTFAAAGIETLTVHATGAASGSTSNVSVGTSNAATKLVITGDQTLKMTASDNAIATIDASAFTGALTLDASTAIGAKDVSLTGGSGNDTLTVGTLGTTDTVDGGAGTDTVVFTASTGTTAFSKVTNVEQVQLTVNTTTSSADIDASVISGATGFIANLTDSASGGGDVDVTFSKFSDSATLKVDASTSTGSGAPTNTITVTHASNTSTNVLSATLVGIGNSATAGLENLTANNAETINLTASANSTGTTTTNYIATLTSSDAKTLNIDGAASLQIGALSASNLKTITVSGSKGIVLTDGGAVARTITLTDAADLLIAGSGNDTITAGAGNDVIITGAGADKVTAGDGDDTVSVGTATAPAVGSTPATAVTVTYSASSQKVSLDGGAGNDTFNFDETGLAYTDTINGGDGTDTITINNNSSGTNIQATGATTDAFKNVTNVESVTLKDITAGGTDTLTFTINDAGLTSTFGGTATLVAYANEAGDTTTVDASGVLAGSGTIKFSAHASNVGKMALKGGGGTDILVGGSAVDTVTYSNGVYLTSSDSLDGGAGSDVLVISSANAATVVASQLTNIQSIESINLDATDGVATTAMSITLSNSAAAANAASSNNAITVKRQNASDSKDDTGTTKIDGSALTSVNLVGSGASGADTIIGGSGNDTLTGGLGIDSLTGGSGDDVFVYTATGDASVSEVVAGGDGTDTIQLTSNVAGTTVDFTNATLSSIEQVDALAGNTSGVAKFTSTQLSATTRIIESTATATEQVVQIVAAGSTVDLSGYTYDSNRTTGVSITNDGSYSSLPVSVTGTTLADSITGGSSADSIIGGLGADTITGGAGNDLITLSEATASSDTVKFMNAEGATNLETIVGFTKGGTSGDVLSFSIGNLGSSLSFGNKNAVANGSTVDLLEVTGASATLTATDNIIVLAGATFSSTANVATAIGGGTKTVTWAASPDANDDIIVVYTDGADAYVAIVNDANSGTDAVMLAADLTVTNIAKLTGITSIAASDFVQANFAFIS